MLGGRRDGSRKPYATSSCASVPFTLEALGWADAMASGPFKIRLKLSKPSETRPEPSQAEKKPQGRKRPRPDEAEERHAASKHLPSASEVREQIQGAAQASKEAVSAFAQPSIQSSGREPAGEASAAASRPRLVIKGSFGERSSKPQESGLSSSLPHDPSKSYRPHKEKKLHKEKKRKKHKERPLEASQQFFRAPQVGNANTPSTIKLLPQAPAKAQTAATQPSKATVPLARADLKNAPETVKCEPAAALPPPAKAQPPAPAKAASQAPSTATGISAEGLTQGSDRPSEHHGGAGASGQEVVSKPLARPALEEVEKLITRLQKKDAQHFFRDPVTDAVAPGYSQVIKRPMSFLQMRQRLAQSEYESWKIVQEDLETMFNNAMVFNAPKSPYHLKAREMMGIARKLLTTIRTTGQLDPRGRKPAGAAKPPQPPSSALTAPISDRRTERRAAVRPERAVKPKVDKKKIAARKAAARAAASGVLAKPSFDDSRSEFGGLSGAQSGRASFPQLQGQPLETQWGGLARGSSAEGVEFGKGRPTLRANFAGLLTLERYSKSLKAFGEKLSGFAKELLDKKLARAAVKPEPKALPAVTRPSAVPSTQAWGPAAAPSLAGWNPLAQGRPLGAPGAAASSLQGLPRPAYLGNLPPYTAAQAYSQPQAASSAAFANHQLRPAASQGVPMVQPQPVRTSQPESSLAGHTVKVEAASPAWQQPPRLEALQQRPMLSQPYTTTHPRHMSNQPGFAPRPVMSHQSHLPGVRMVPPRPAVAPVQPGAQVMSHAQPGNPVANSSTGLPNR